MEKNLDKQGRWRNKTVSFRMSKEEVILLNNLVDLSGLTKQDYKLNAKSPPLKEWAFRI
jgi:hypothetical protein